MVSKAQKITLKSLLVARGLCEDAKDAQSWIMAGKVLVNDQRIDKAGQLVSRDADVRIKGLSKYAGRGGYKLEGALSDFHLDVRGKIVLDAGAAAGGFTDCLLQHGAKKVYAVDVGFGSLTGKLQNDERVINLERTNISDLAPEHLIPLPSLATVDLSYLSLREAIPIVANLLEPDGELICLVKPLFEISDSKARRTGVIKESSAYVKMLQDLLSFINNIGMHSKGLTHSHVPGSRGTREFFLWIKKNSRMDPQDINIETVVRDVLAL